MKRVNRVLRDRPNHRGGRHIFYTVLISVLLVALVPIFFLSASFYYKSYRDIVASVSDFQDRYLEDFSARFDRVLSDSIEQAHELAQSESIQDVEQYPDTAFYEQLTGPYSQEALYGLYDYLQRKDACLAELASFSNRNRYVQRVEYYIDKLRWGLDSRSRAYPINPGDRELVWYEWYERDDSSAYSVFFEARKVLESPRDAIVIAVKPFWNSGGTCVITYIDIDLALADIIETLPAFPETGLFALADADGRELFAAASPGYDRGSSSGRMTEKATTLGTTGFVVSLAISKDEYMRRLRGIGVIAFLSAALVLLISVLAVLISLRITRPITRLAAMVGLPATAAGNEVQQIEHGLTQLMNEKTALEFQVRSSTPIYRENFLRAMLFGESYSRGEIARQFAALSIPLEPENVIVLILSLELSPAQETVNTQRTQTLSVKNAVHRLLVEQGNGSEIELTMNRIAVIVNATTKTQNDVLLLADRIQEEVAGRDTASTIIGIGYPYERLEMIRQSFQEAEEALNYVSLRPARSSRVFFIGDIRLIRARPFIYPVEQEVTLSNMIMSGNRSAALETYDSLIQSFQKQRLILHKYRIHHIILRMMNMISARYNEIEPSHKVPVDHYVQVIQSLEEGHENEAFDLLRTVISDLADKIRNRYAEREFVVAGRICEMIDNDYPNITLQSVSDELSLSTSLVSTLFKKIKGVGFSDYVTSYRIERGMDLLKNSDLSVGQIARRVGYSNSNYFIRIFRHQNDMTPGEFRKMFRSGIKAG